MQDEAIERIRAAKLRRLEELEVQIAVHGEIDSPPHLLTQRDQLRTELGLLDPIGKPPIDAATRRTVRKYYQDDLDFLMDQLAKFGQRLTSLEETVRLDLAARRPRQLVLNVWLGGISATVIMVAIGVLALLLK